MTTAFERVIQDLGLSAEHQNELGWVHALLSYADSVHDSGDGLTDTEPNPAAEVIRRFAAANLNPSILTTIKQRLATLDAQYQQGNK